MRRTPWLIITLLVLLTGLLPAPPPRALAQGGGADPELPVTEDTFFQLIIPTLEVNITVFQAWVSRRTWEFRVFTEEAGHLQYTSYPGEGRNVVIGAHYELADFSPGPFFHLDRLAEGDLIFVYFMGRPYTYQVIHTGLVPPTDITIIQPTTFEALTLLTCYHYSPRAEIYTSRYIVRAVGVPNPDPLPDLLAVGQQVTPPPILTPAAEPAAQSATLFDPDAFVWPGRTWDDVPPPPSP